MKKEQYYILIFVVLGLLLAGIIFMVACEKNENDSSYRKGSELKTDKKEEMMEVESVNLLEEDIDFDEDFLEDENEEELDVFDEELDFEVVSEQDLNL